MTKPAQVWNPEILKYFQYEHLQPDSLARKISKQFCDLAMMVVKEVPENSERDGALRRLLEAKDCAVRASLP